MNQLAPLAIAIPLLAAAGLCGAASLLGRAAVDAVAIAVAAAVTAMLLVLLVHVSSGTRVYWLGGWHPRAGVAIGVDLAVGPIGAGLAAFVSLLTVLGLVFGSRGIDLEHPYYEALLLTFMAGMVGFCLSGDLFNMFVLFELMSISAVALVGYKVHERAGVEGGLNFGVINVIGSFLFLIGIALVYSRTGALNLAQIGRALTGAGPSPAIVAAFALIAGAMLIKAAIAPFHFWLADAYAVAPTPVCLLLAGAMSELGLYGLGRIWFATFAPALGGHHELISAVLVAAGVLTALVGGVMALLEDHLKRLLAFVTVSFVGVFLTGLGLLSVDGVAATAVYVLADGFGKALLFACLGIVQHRYGRLSIQRLHGRGREMRLTAALYFAGGLLVAALPPFGPFLGKSMIEDAAIKAGYWYVPSFVVLASALTGGAVLMAGARVFLGWGEPGGGSAGADEDTEREGDGSDRRTPATMTAVAVALLAGAIGTGVWFSFADLATTAAHNFLDEGAYRAAVLHGALTHAAHESSSSPRWFDFLYCGGATVLAVCVAALGLWGKRLTPGWQRLMRSLAAVTRPLRRMHSGRIGDYVAALALGIGVFGALMALTLA
jgi:multicomponent Na+:H+ antiporter subunit D